MHSYGAVHICFELCQKKINGATDKNSLTYDTCKRTFRPRIRPYNYIVLQDAQRRVIISCPERAFGYSRQGCCLGSFQKETSL